MSSPAPSRFASSPASSRVMIGSPTKRRELDVMKLMMSDYNVKMAGDLMNEFIVVFHGPKDTPYADGVWNVRVQLPDNYPYKSPSIGFMNRIFHPNVDEMSGSVCLDVINQTWSPMFDLVNVFDVFLPQLLTYPNPADPMNGEAAAMLLRDPQGFNRRVKDYVERYAKGDISMDERNDSGGEDGNDDCDEANMSSSDSGSDVEDLEL